MLIMVSRLIIPQLASVLAPEQWTGLARILWQVSSAIDSPAGALAGLALLGLGLAPEAQELLLSLALLKIRRLLDGGLRLRTACDLKRVGELRVDGMDGLPDGQRLLATVQSAIAACTQKAFFAVPPVTELTTDCARKKSKKESRNGQ